MGRGGGEDVRQSIMVYHRFASRWTLPFDVLTLADRHQSRPSTQNSSQGGLGLESAVDVGLPTDPHCIRMYQVLCTLFYAHI